MSQIGHNETDDLHHKLQRAKRDFAILYEVSNAMRTTLELNHILYIILTGVTSHTGLGFNRAILFLANDELSFLEPKMAIGPKSGQHAQEIWAHISSSQQNLEDLIKEDKLAQNTDQSSLFKDVKDLKIPLAEGENNILSKAFYDGIPRRMLDHEIDERRQDIFLKTFQTNELILIPLKIKDKVIGLIVADNIYTQRSPSEDDLRMFMTLANQAALAIENSRLYGLIKHQSDTDPITNLWNHGFFQHKLSTLIKETKDAKSILSLMIIDIDNFKTLNDTFGHQFGDHVLKIIAHVLKDSSREIDFVCRYGGEEFSIILPQTNKNQAFSIAERIREKIKMQSFQEDQTGKAIQLTVSIGIATLDKAQSKEELIKAADQAMYQAKRNGKNQTCSF